MAKCLVFAVTYDIELSDWLIRFSHVPYEIERLPYIVFVHSLWSQFGLMYDCDKTCDSAVLDQSDFHLT